MLDNSEDSSQHDPDATGEYQSGSLNEASREKNEEKSESQPKSDIEETLAPTLDGTPNQPSNGQSSSSSGLSATSWPFSAATNASGQGSLFGDYTLESEIARGGMGVVFRARQARLNRQVALKMILAGQLASEEEIRRFYAEAEAAAKLDHPNIVPIFEIGQHADTHFFSMKLIEGSDLAKQLPKLRGDLKTTIELLEKVCRGVAHAHQRGVLHRDLKPANILIDSDGEPFIADLGLARHVGTDSNMTRTGAIVGTPSYMSPEQASGSSDLTTSTDVYSLGAILYEILTGQPPFRGKTPMDTLLQVINDLPQSPSMSGATDRNLELVALKCLAKDPADRYQSAQQLADDLARWLKGEPLAIRTPSVTVLVRTWLHQNFGRAVWILFVGVIGGLVAGFGIWNATVQREIVSNTRYVYGELPSVEAPGFLMNWITPQWLVLPSLLVFVSALSLLGFFTAWLVRTKNTSADIAAGLAVGIISSAAAFFFAFAPMSISVSTDRGDLNLLGMLGNAPLDETPQPILDAYPEMASMTRNEQVQLLKLKLDVDRTLSIPRGLTYGTLACFLLFVGAGVAETVIAGRALRRQAGWWRALVEYLFCSIPYVAFTTFVGLHLAVALVFGSSGVIADWLGLLPLLVFTLALFAEVKKWSLRWRLPANIVSSAVLVMWFLTDFSLLPQMAGARSEITKATQRAEAFPQNSRLKVAAANAYQSLGIGPFNIGRFEFALTCFLDGIEYLEGIPKDQQSDALDGLHGVAYTNSAAALWKLGRRQAAIDLLHQGIDRAPDSSQMIQRVATFMLQQDLQEEVEEIFETIVIEHPKDWARLLRVAYAIESREFAAAGPGGSPDTQQAGIAAADRVRRFIQKSLSGDLRDRLIQVPILRRWHVRLLHDVSAEAELQETLVGGDLSWIKDGIYPEDFGVTDQSETQGVSNLTNASPRAVLSFSHLPVDLARLYPDAGIRRSAYAITEIESDKEEAVTISLGSDDGFELWLNGKRLGGYAKSRPYVEREDQFEAVLQEGRNAILLRVDQNSGPWQFDLQIDAADGWPLSR